MARSLTSSRSTFVMGAIAVALVAVVAVVLTVLALGHVRAETPGALAPVVPIPDEASTATPTPTTTQTAAAVPVYERSSELFLTVGDGALWRGRAGGCGSQPLLERSIDDGATWADVTPLYLGVAQLMAVTPLQDFDAGIIATTGAACETQALRTYTQGEFWEASDDVLASSRWIDSADPGLVHLSGSTAGAPCANARGLRASEGLIALVCDGRAWEWTGSTWEAVPVGGVAAVALDGGTLLIARSDSACDGVALVRIAGESPQQLGCAAGIDPGAAVAMAADDAEVLVWAGGDVIRLPLPSGG